MMGIPGNPTPGFYVVMRHGGRSIDNWRIAACSTTEALATEKYTAIKMKMRQGGLSLLDPKGVEIRHYEAPLLRTNW